MLDNTPTDLRFREMERTSLQALMDECESAARGAAWSVERDIELNQPEQITWVAERMLIGVDEALAKARAIHDDYANDPRRSSGASIGRYRCAEEMGKHLDTIKRYKQVIQDASIAAYIGVEDEYRETVEISATVLVNPARIDIDSDEARRLAARQPELDEDGVRYAFCQQLIRRALHGSNEHVSDWSIVRRNEDDAENVVRLEVSADAEYAKSAGQLVFNALSQPATFARAEGVLVPGGVNVSGPVKD